MSAQTYIVPRELLLRVDEIARLVYGTEGGGNTEAILDANPGLASIGELVPAGTAISIPERTATPKPVAVVNPWD